MINDNIAGNKSPDTIHTMKNIGIAIAALVIATDLAGKSSSVLTLALPSGAFLVASTISIMPFISASRIMISVYNPPTSIVPTPTILLLPLMWSA